MTWRKSTYSGGSSTQSDCVELARLSDGIGVRDSKAPGAGHLLLSRRGFADLMARFKQDAAGE
ncbi:DUF397 domain-containing protein [Actinomadura madurae]|uniref:DUF397 domain-containing protein n=1 Tax=Actinomadura madurae TaxID=1993 RepID=UPI000D91F822|nr:Domain of uncharacterised function (DUF397) [Actinomadura madurae]